MIKKKKKHFSCATTRLHNAVEQQNVDRNSMKHADTESVGNALNQDDQKSRYHFYDKAAHCHWSTISDFCASAQVPP